MKDDFNKLSELAKIRKFVFNDVKNSSDTFNELFEAYNTYWLEMENNFLNVENVNLFEQFIIDYLTIQNNGVIPNRLSLLKSFTEYYSKATKFQKKEIVLRNIYRYSVYYMQISFCRIKDEEIKNRIEMINSYEAKDAYPFLMEVFEDYDYAHINKNMLLDILDTVLGFIEDRNSCTPSQSALSFAGLSTEINKMMVLKDYVPRFVEDIEPKHSTINEMNFAN